jgi:hypothetical protein
MRSEISGRVRWVVVVAGKGQGGPGYRMNCEKVGWLAALLGPRDPHMDICKSDVTHILQTLCGM